jgi:two-component system alkaline phosphatase synthesis response regulator PhoP
MEGQQQPQQQQAKKKILIIEDDPLLVKMYSTKFASEGFQVLSASDGLEGLKIALEQVPDVIILDIMMPKMSGHDVLAKMRNSNKTNNIPVIVLSNLTQRTEAQKALDLGAKEYMAKASFTPGQVIERVKKYV